MENHSGELYVPLDKISDQSGFGLTVDVVILGYTDELNVLTIESDMPCFKGLPSVLGDIILPAERLAAGAARILKHYTGLEGLPLEQLGAFDDPDRHPVGRVITIGFFSLVHLNNSHFEINPRFGAKWVPVKQITKMAFDHKKILDAALCHMRGNIDRITLRYGAPQKTFTLSTLQRYHEDILGEPLDKRNFIKRLKNLGYIQDTGKRQTNVSHRPAKLFKLARKK
jgi:8-oxo-dGTP diphosphatase